MRVALTFDAEHPDRPRCPPGIADAILDVLGDLDVRATFFLQGRWAEAYPEAARRVAQAGHQVGAHSHFHVRMPLLSDAGLRADLADAGRAITEAADVDPRPWFRCPWGDGARDPRVLGALEEGGFRHVGWDVVAEDWEPDRSAEDIERAIVEGVAAFGDGAVALLHAWPGPTLTALPRILDRLRAGGEDLVTVGELGRRNLGATANPLTASA